MLCFRKFLVAKKFMDNREGEASKIPSKIFCLTVPKKAVVEPFSLSLISGIEKFYASEGLVTIFRRKFFVSQYRNISQRNPYVLCFRRFLVAKKFMDKREGEVSRFSFNFFMSHSAQRIRRGPLSLSLFSSIEKVWMRGWGECQVFPSKFFCLAVPKIVVGDFFSASVFSGNEKC